MWENSTTVSNLIQSLPISEFISAVIGGGLTIAGSIYSLRYQQFQNNKRLRRALISEINSIEAGQLHLGTSMLRTDEGGLDFLDEFAENHFSELINSISNGSDEELVEELVDELVDPEEMKKESMKKAGNMITSVNLSTPIWDSNTDKIGNLKTDNIEKLIRFYRLLAMCKQLAGNAVDAVEQEARLDEDDELETTESFEYSMRVLQKKAKALTERKKEALEALDADEFIEIKDSYLIYTEEE